MTTPSLERMAHLTVLAWEAALATLASHARNGRPLPADVVWCVNRLALTSPQTAARCPQVRAALNPETRAAVFAQVDSAGETRVDATPPAPAPSEPMGAREAAGHLGITVQAVRGACRRGTLTATRHPRTGEWEISAAALEEYRRTRATHS